MAKFDLTIVATHIPGKENEAAAALSRDNLPLFHAQVPHAAKNPSKVPQELLKLLVYCRPDWISADWRNLYVSIFQGV